MQISNTDNLSFEKSGTQLRALRYVGYKFGFRELKSLEVKFVRTVLTVSYSRECC
jgi:hypothetical protein